jgi:V8-like Glu-specific endopeptidase
MATKTMSQRTNGGHTETYQETPPNAEHQKQRMPYGSFPETEVEDVQGGFTLVRPEEADREISNVFDGEEISGREATMEEPGIELATEEAQPLDALFASYSHLFYQIQQGQQETGEELSNRRVPIQDNRSFPWRAICKLIITGRDNTRWEGTGFLIAPRTVITAGHNVFLHEHGGWAKSIEVIPGLLNQDRPYGSAVARVFKTVIGWTKGKNKNQDYAAIILPTHFRPGERTGTFGFAVKETEFLKRATLNMAYYPFTLQGQQGLMQQLQQQSQQQPQFQQQGQYQQQPEFAGQYQQEYQQSEGQEGFQQEGQQQPFQHNQQSQQPFQQGQMQQFQRPSMTSKQLYFIALHTRNVNPRLIQYDTEVKDAQGGAPVWTKSGLGRSVVAIHSNAFASGDTAIRITPQVFSNLSAWKLSGM